MRLILVIMIIAAVAIAALALVVESDHNYLRDAATRGLYYTLPPVASVATATMPWEWHKRVS
jgi:hypothetical protein